MVVLDILPGVEVWVEVGGQPLQEYEDQGDNPDQGDSATRFIPAESEQHFKIGILAANTHGWKGEGLSVLVDIDGRSSKGFLLFKDRVNKKPKRLIGGGLNLAEGKMVKYKFSNLDIDTVDDSTHSKRESKRLSHVGSIRIRLCDITDIVERGYEPREPWELPKGVGVVTEKAMKGQALSHTVQFGEAVEDRSASAVVMKHDYKYMDPKRKAAVTYTFCYRSMDALKFMLIIPRTPSPEPPTPLEERDITTLNPEELRELQARFLAMRDQQAQVKRERAEDEADARARKRSRSSMGDTQLEIDGQGGFSQVSTAAAGEKERVVIELD